MILCVRRWLARRSERAARDRQDAEADAALWDQHKDMASKTFTGNGWPGEGGYMGGS